MFGNMGFTEIMIVLVLVLLIFGAKRLPEIGSSMGRGIREFKRSLSDTQDSLNAPDKEPRQVPRSLDEQQVAPPASGEPKRLSQ